MAGLAAVDDLKILQRELRSNPLKFSRDDGNAVVAEGKLDATSDTSVAAMDMLTDVSPWKSRMLSKNSRRRTLPSSSVIIFRYCEIDKSPM